MFEFTVTNCFVIKELGVILTGSWKGEGTFGPGDTLVSDTGKVVRVSGIHFPNGYNTQIGLKVDLSADEAMTLISHVLKKPQ